MSETVRITCSNCGHAGDVEWPDDLIVPNPRCGPCGARLPKWAIKRAGLRSETVASDAGCDAARANQKLPAANPLAIRPGIALIEKPQGRSVKNSEITKNDTEHPSQ